MKTLEEMSLDDENEDILVQIQEEQQTISSTFRPEASSGRVPFSLPDEASGRNIVEVVFCSSCICTKMKKCPTDV